jgi:hypothetical protein
MTTPAGKKMDMDRFSLNKLNEGGVTEWYEGYNQNISNYGKLTAGVLNLVLAITTAPSW